MLYRYCTSIYCKSFVRIASILYQFLVFFITEPKSSKIEQGTQLGNMWLLEQTMDGSSKRTTVLWQDVAQLRLLFVFALYWEVFVLYLFLTTDAQFVCRLVCFLPGWRHSQMSPPATASASYISQARHFFVRYFSLFQLLWLYYTQFDADADSWWWWG